jgi:MFS family permease
MLSILWYSICNFIAGFSPSFTFLFVLRAMFSIGMGAEWPAGASLAMESTGSLATAGFGARSRSAFISALGPTYPQQLDRQRQAQPVE